MIKVEELWILRIDSLLLNLILITNNEEKIMFIKPEVDIHTHTIASTHAYSTIHDYVRCCIKNGIKMFAVTDHGPDMEDAPHEWHFQNSLIFPRIDDGIGILRGIESNIRDINGNIDCNEKIHANLDIILCGFHRQVFAPQSREINTEAMVNAIRSGKVHVITHPGNPKFPIDPVAIAKAAAECNVALEVNNSSFVHSRKGSHTTCSEIIKMAKKYDAPMSIGSDAHIAYDVGRFDKAIEMLVSNGYPTERIINRTIDSLFDYLESKNRFLRSDFSEILG